MVCATALSFCLAKKYMHSVRVIHSCYQILRRNTQNEVHTFAKYILLKLWSKLLLTSAKWYKFSPWPQWTTGGRERRLRLQPAPPSNTATQRRTAPTATSASTLQATPAMHRTVNTPSRDVSTAKFWCRRGIVGQTKCAQAPATSHRLDAAGLSTVTAAVSAAQQNLSAASKRLRSARHWSWRAQASRCSACEGAGNTWVGHGSAWEDQRVLYWSPAVAVTAPTGFTLQLAQKQRQKLSCRIFLKRCTTTVEVESLFWMARWKFWKRWGWQVSTEKPSLSLSLSLARSLSSLPLLFSMYAHSSCML